jgi:uncharacterized protein YcaQ
MTALRIDNRAARALWLDSHGLATPPTGPLDTRGLIQTLGFVQLDSIQVVSRAHHHILWSRNQHYREPMLNRLLKDRAVFEHFTHDASVLPMEMLPLWRRQFERMRDKVARSSWHGPTLRTVDVDALLRRVADEGPLSTQAFDSPAPDAPRAMWQRPAHKVGLDYLWYAGELATCHRDGFTKVYDLAERVFPADLRRQEVPVAAQIDALCDTALDRIGFGTLTEIRRFWEAVETAEVTGWAERRQRDLLPVEVQSADGRWTRALAMPQIEARLAALPRPTSRLRILNPFDPAIRDRARLKRLFGFDYTVEMFLPAAKRQWGYYVFPMLEGDRFVGRLEAKADRAAGTLRVLNLWWEPAVQVTAARQAKLDAELDRLGRFIGVGDVVWGV